MMKTNSKRNNIKKILSTKMNFSLLFSQFCYYKNNGMLLKDISKIIQINWRTLKSMDKKYNLLEKIHSVSIDKAIKEKTITTLIEVELFEFLIKDGNFFMKYPELNKKFPVSRYFYNRVKNYILEEIQ